MMATAASGTGTSRVDLAESADFVIGGLRVSPARREVSMNGERREIEPRVAQVLVALASVRPEVVSRERLIDQCWDGRIVGDDALNRCIVALRHLSKEFTPEPFAIETVPRVGYYLVEREPPTGGRGRGWRGPRMFAAGALAFLAASGAGIYALRNATADGPRPSSIAVIPFRNLSSGDPYFAEGISEEIRDQLSLEPQFRVAGGNSSNQFSGNLDVRDVARRLKVDYVLEGSVQTQGRRVRVNSDLVRASDGMRLWSDRFEGEVSDIFAIQQNISSAIATSLRRKLIRAPVLRGPLVTNGQAHALYLTANGLLKTGDIDVGETAQSVLRDSLNADPKYAPAWVSLADATEYAAVRKGTEPFIDARRQALRYVTHALTLSPDLPQAHRQLGLLLPYASPESKAHLSRAAELNPNDAENLLALGLVEGANGEFSREIESYRRANEVDPLWYRTTGQLAIALAEMGRRGEAEAVGRRGFANNPPNMETILGRIAAIVGDFSEAMRHWSIVASSKSPRWSLAASRSIDETKYLLNLSGGAVGTVPRPPDRRRFFRAWNVTAPTPSEWKSRNRDAIAADQYRDDNHVSAKVMLNAGRARELVATYDSNVGLMSLRPRRAIRVDQLNEAPVVALALLRTHRAAEANNLLRQADSLVRTVYRRTPVPLWFEADAAAVLAVEGKRGEAMATLERAIARGWSHTGVVDLPLLSDEPAFRSLLGNPRFERICASLRQLKLRERAEAIRLDV